MRLRSEVGVVLAVALILAMPAGIAARAKTSQAAPSKRDTAKYEQWLTQHVRHELVMLPWLSVFDDLKFKVEEDRVTLMGSVVRPSLKTDAENVVKKIEGVSQVTNKIEVLPPSPNDDRIRMAAYRAIYGESALARYAIQAVPPIHIIVNRGHLTLKGVVASQTDKNIAGIRAREVAGAFTVTNNLRVEK